MYLYVKTRVFMLNFRVFMLIFRVLDVLKGLGARPHQRGRLRVLEHELLRFWNGPCIHRFVYMYVGLCMHMHSFDDPTSNGHNSLNLSPN